MATADSLLALLALLVTFTPGTPQSWLTGDALRYLPEPSTRPSPDDDKSPLEVRIDVSLTNILGVYNNKEVEVLVWLSMHWSSRDLSVFNGFWNSVYEVTLPSKHLWLPDITVYNAVSRPEVLSPDVVNLRQYGSVRYVSSLRVRVPCDLQYLETESGATCTLKLASWAHTNRTLTMTTSESSNSLTDYVPNTDYDILSTSTSRHTTTYPFCPGDSYEGILFNFSIRSTRQTVPLWEAEELNHNIELPF
ncbi:hypothetical protein BsWGS_22702 [Bradybaena similaris]